MKYQDPSLTPAQRAADLLPRLSLREKVGQLNQRLTGFACYQVERGRVRLSQELIDEVQRFHGLGCLYGLYRADPWSRRDFSNGLAGPLMKQAYNAVQRLVLEHSPHRIPMLMSSECPHGHQALNGYLLPVNLACGAAWDPELVKRAYAVCGAQLRELGVDLALVSMLDVLRDPRWGRSEECYSEDPFLCAALARAAVAGCRTGGTEVVAKHFCAQGETTGGVNASAARIGPRELREVHLPPARAAVEAGAQGVMAAYNEIDGVFCHANRELLTGILREELGFTGLVMADGVAVDRLTEFTGSPAASAALALNAGVQMSLWDRAFSALEEAVEQGLASEEAVDRAVLAVLELKFRRGLFERPFLEEEPPKLYAYSQHPESLQLARESVVLLKNQGVLPLKGAPSIAVLGPNGNALYNQLGDYTPPQPQGSGVTVYQGLRALLGDRVGYAQGCSLCGEDESGFAPALALAESSDLVLLVLGGSSSRFGHVRFDANGAALVDHSDSSVDGNPSQDTLEMDCGEGVDCPSLRLPGVQEKLAEAVFSLGKPVVTLIIAGRPYAIPRLAERSEALLYSFYPGPMGGQALAEILTGRIDPSGRLPVTLPQSVGGLPCAYNHKASCQPAQAPLYPFGFGLSYTQFQAEGLALEEEPLQVKFTITNTGERAGTATPQIYFRRLAGPTVPRVKELAGFCRVELAPGESRACAIPLGPLPRPARIWLELGPHAKLELK